MIKKVIEKLCITIIVLSSLFIIINIYTDYKNTKTLLYSYQIKKDSNYKVLLKPNNFYTSKTLPENNYYVSSSIDYLNMNINYKFNSKNLKPIKYSYNLTENIYGVVDDDENKKEVWNRLFYIKKSNTKTTKNNFSINENLNINYNYYKNIVYNFEKEYNIKINSILKIKLNIFYKINNKNYKDYLELEIPINNTVTEVKKNYKNINNKNIYHSNNINIIKYIIPIILIIISIFIVLNKSIYLIKNYKERYNKRINNILKDYKELIITITNKPTLTDLNTMSLEKIEDLIDIAEQTNNNIIHYEVSKNKENIFFVIHNNYVYIYKYESTKN